MASMSRYNQNRMMGLKKEHNLAPRFSWSVTHRIHTCLLINTMSGQQVHSATSPVSEEEAFNNAANTINLSAVEAEPGQLASENADLREKLRDLESKMEEPSTPVDTPAEDAAGDDKPGEPAKKVRRRRRTKSAETAED